jgi:hypothetical protein
MKKMLLVLMLVLAMVIMAVQAFACGDERLVYIWAGSGVSVESMATNNGSHMSAAAAWNTSHAEVNFRNNEVSTIATSCGGSLGFGASFTASQFGSAFAYGQIGNPPPPPPAD